MSNPLSVLEKCRQALIYLIRQADVGTENIYNEKNSADKEAPNVSVGASSAQEDPIGTGNFWVMLEVQVRVPAAVPAPMDIGEGLDPKPAGDELTANVFAVLEVDNLAEQMSAFVPDGETDPQLTVMGFDAQKELEQSVVGDCWVETWRRRAYACGSSI